MIAGQETATPPRLMESDVDGLSITFWLGGAYRGQWDVWIDWDEPGDLPPEELEMWAMVRALRAKLIALYGPNGSQHEHFIFGALPTWERQAAA